MKSPFDRSTAFTLIELLAVMAIILVLAGLIINIAGSAQYNSAKQRATAEVNALSLALENYKTDNGAYPSDPNSTELLNAQKNFDPVSTDMPTYAKSSEFLYQQLSGLQPGATTLSKAYIQFTPQQLHVAADAPSSDKVASTTSAFMYIIDPFAFSYGYSTLYAATVAATPSATPAPAPPTDKGYNPTFDLWSTAGYASGGKTKPATNVGGGDAAIYSSLWVKNW